MLHETLMTTIVNTFTGLKFYKIKNSVLVRQSFLLSFNVYNLGHYQKVIFWQSFPGKSFSEEEKAKEEEKEAVKPETTKKAASPIGEEKASEEEKEVVESEPAKKAASQIKEEMANEEEKEVVQPEPSKEAAAQIEEGKAREEEKDAVDPWFIKKLERKPEKREIVIPKSEFRVRSPRDQVKDWLEKYKM